MRNLAGITIVLALAAVVLVQLGCSRDPVSSYDPILVNDTDNFHLVLKDAKSVDTVVYYYWSNDGSSANIDQAADIKGGQITITIDDHDLVRVYSTDFKQSGSFTTQPGVPGLWRIRVSLADFSGLADFRAQRR
jgi:hypothetical protein